MPDPEEFDPENPPPSIVVMSMGTDTTDLIVTNGIKLWMRNIPIGGNHFTRQLSRELKLTQAKAEHLKRNARQSENPKAVFKAMRPVFNDLVNEVQRSLTFFQSMEKNAVISEILLLGNAGKLPGLRQFLNKQLEIDIAKASDFKRLTGSEVIAQSTFQNNLLSFAPCYGLCLQGLNKGQIKTNLLPQEIVVERVVRAKKPWVLASVGALMLGLVLGLFFKGQAWWNVNPKFADSAGVTWDDAMRKVKAEKTKSDGFQKTDADLKALLEKFNAIGNELVASSEGKGTWLEIYSALYQALPKDPRIQKEIEAGAIAIDPATYPFNDREELYIDHVESVFFKDLGIWYGDVKPIHDHMFDVLLDDLAEAKRAGGDAEKLEEVAASTADSASEEAAEDPFTGKPGWIIEIRGHHFHNSLDKVREYNSAKSYLLNSFIKPLMEKTDVILPDDGGQKDLYAYSDIGLLFPTITRSSDRTEKIIQFDPTKTAGESTSGRPGMRGGGDDVGGGMNMGLGGGMGRGGAAGGTGQNTGVDENAELDKTIFKVYEYKFVVQIAWIPRTPQERMEARKLRLEKEATQKQAEAEAQAQPAEADAAANPS